MASATLSKLVQNDKETKQELKKINGTLQKMYSAQIDAAKKEAKIARRTAQTAKRKSGDQTLKNMFGIDKKEVKKEQKNFLQKLMDGLLGGIGGILGAIKVPALLGALGLGTIGATIAGYIGSEKFRNFINENIFTPAWGVIKEGLIGEKGLFGAENRKKTWEWIKENPLKTLGLAVAGITAIIGPKTALGLAFSALSKTIPLIAGGIGSIVNGLKTAGILKAGAGAVAAKAGAMVAAPIAIAAGAGIISNQFIKGRYGGGEAGDIGLSLYQEELRLDATKKNKRGRQVKEYTEEEKQRKKEIAEIRKELIAIKNTRDEAISNATKIAPGTRGRKKITDQTAVDLANKEYEESFLKIKEKYKLQKGGPLPVPGTGSGDKVPALLPEGSFVLNRNASGFQNGGLVPALLEPGEQVYGPGSWGMREMILNSAMPRFQSGGFVGTSRDQMVDTGDVDGKGRPILLSPGAAAAWKKMRQAGMPMNSGDVTNVWRNEAEYNRLIAAGYKPAANSHHNHGEAADIHGEMNKWIRANGAQYGWVANDYSGSHGGHFEYKGPGARQKAGASSKDQDGGAGSQENGAGAGLISSVGGQIGDFLRGVGDGLSEVFGGTGLDDVLKMLMGGGKNGGGGVTFGGGGGGGGNTPGGTGPVDMGKDVNEKLMKTAKLAMEAGFTKEQAKVMAAIAGGESSFNNRAHNPNRATGDNSYGLWQINMIDQLGVERRRNLGLSSNEDLFDPATNARAAKAIFDSQGYGAWGAYKDGNAAKYMNAAKALKLQNGGLVNMSGYRGGSPISQRSEDQFIEKMAAAVTPVVIPVPTGGGSGASQVTVSKGVQDVPTLSAYPDNPMALDLANRLSLGAAFA